MSRQSRIRVLIVDDHAVVRSGLAALLMFFEDLDLVGAASDGEEAISLCSQTHPHVVLMDLMMPGMSGFEAISLIRQNNPDVYVVALTNFEDEQMVRKALSAGANGYLLKNVSATQLADAIRNAYAGELTVSPEVAQLLISRSLASAIPAEDGMDNLTDREIDVLELLVEGLSNKEIANRLIIGATTVKTHLSNIFSKLGVSSRVEAVRVALESGLLPRYPPSG